MVSRIAHGKFVIFKLKLKVFVCFVGEECKKAVIADPHHFRIVDEDGIFVSRLKIQPILIEPLYTDMIATVSVPSTMNFQRRHSRCSSRLETLFCADASM